MFKVWLATVSLLLKETHLLLFVIYFETIISFANGNYMTLFPLRESCYFYYYFYHYYHYCHFNITQSKRSKPF